MSVDGTQVAKTTSNHLFLHKNAKLLGGCRKGPQLIFDPNRVFVHTLHFVVMSHFHFQIPWISLTAVQS